MPNQDQTTLSPCRQTESYTESLTLGSGGTPARSPAGRRRTSGRTPGSRWPTPPWLPAKGSRPPGRAAARLLRPEHRLSQPLLRRAVLQRCRRQQVGAGACRPRRRGACSPGPVTRCAGASGPTCGNRRHDRGHGQGPPDRRRILPAVRRGLHGPAGETTGRTSGATTTASA